MSLREALRVYWNRQPCAIRHSPAHPYSQQFFADISRRKYFVQPHVHDLAQFGRWAGKKVLEIGCGIGTDAEQFAAAGAVYTGIDMSDVSLDIARARFKLRRLNGTFYIGDGECLGDVVPVERYDLVYAFGVLHHTPEPEAVLAEAHKYMDEQSELRLMVYAEHSWKAAMIRAGLDQSEAQANCPLARRYTQQEAKELLTRAGYGVTRLWQDHVFPYQVGPYKAWRYEREAWFAAMSPEMFRALETHLGWHMLIWARPLDTPRVRPGT